MHRPDRVSTGRIAGIPINREEANTFMRDGGLQVRLDLAPDISGEVQYLHPATLPRSPLPAKLERR